MEVWGLIVDLPGLSAFLRQCCQKELFHSWCDSWLKVKCVLRASDSLSVVSSGSPRVVRSLWWSRARVEMEVACPGINTFFQPPPGSGKGKRYSRDCGSAAALQLLPCSLCRPSPLLGFQK